MLAVALWLRPAGAQDRLSVQADPGPATGASSATPVLRPLAAPVFDGDRLLAPTELDGGRLALAPYDGRSRSSREQVTQDFRSAEPAFWADLGVTEVRGELGLARVSVNEPGAVLRDAPAWVAVYQYDGAAASCPPQLPPKHRSAAPTVAPTPRPDTTFHAFVLPLGDGPAFLWTGQGLGICEPLTAPRVEPAMRHESAAWVELSRTASRARLEIRSGRCPSQLESVATGTQTGGGGLDVKIVTTSPLPQVPRCPYIPPPQVPVDLPAPGVVLGHAPVGVLGSP